MISLVVLMLLIFTLPQKYPNSTRGQTPSNNKRQSFVCSSYLLDKVYWYVNIINDC